MAKISILGSINMDIVLKVDRMAKVGETLLTRSLDKVAGGKGANQGVAAARLGSKVYMIGKLGKDDNGDILYRNIENDNINVEYILKDDKEPTGMAIVTVDKDGNNSIVVVSGANMSLKKEDIYQFKEAIKDSNILITQFETPIDVAEDAFKLAKSFGVTTILNPAPAKEITENLLKNTDIIIPNEMEAFEITKIKIKNENDIKKSAQVFLERGIKFVIITLGEKGAAIISKYKFEIIPAYKVNAIDTTAAGDSFIGALAHKLGEKELSFENIKEGVLYGNKVSSIVVQKEGAQSSIPYLSEVKEVFKEN
ncbi:ribokinase [Clostridium tetani]|uniref:Ribokinase n=1 Tax=Clostridium tetani (strain Massachusetts / E88) TaxID=212717 RepID=Q891L9_CLOTE|nr:ribokinase [Clostridium tetani]AAO36826.1 ribokinase [Clostridium tetani E88]KGI39166.1 ribokinase [Clostridium tetani ATCC 9441]KGI41213.1 ribokinase [Clostridium tetani]KGI45961.1 ribokinase [Clostridium tetani]KHO31171.1 ribokinase [Clostridium tetani]